MLPSWATVPTRAYSSVVKAMLGSPTSVRPVVTVARMGSPPSRDTRAFADDCSTTLSAYSECRVVTVPTKVCCCSCCSCCCCCCCCSEASGGVPSFLHPSHTMHPTASKMTPTEADMLHATPALGFMVVVVVVEDTVVVVVLVRVSEVVLVFVNEVVVEVFFNVVVVVTVVVVVGLTSSFNASCKALVVFTSHTPSTSKMKNPADVSQVCSERIETWPNSPSAVPL
mmetsp:Transcript_12181/g.32686  ORF Transcript_12181/g.32686 Transcript_12181/m.32686 type:complete len:226 (+) Transcript_12181:238-915(+)